MACFMSRRLYRPKRLWQPACPHCHLSTLAGVSGMSSSADRQNAHAGRFAGAVDFLRRAAVSDCYCAEETYHAEHRAHQTARLPQSPAAPSRLSGLTDCAPGGCCWGHPATAPPHPRPEQATANYHPPEASTKRTHQVLGRHGSRKHCLCQAIMRRCSVMQVPLQSQG